MNFRLRSLLVVFAVLVFASCQKDDETQIQDISIQDIPVPDNIAIDMDEDGIDDYHIYYFRAIIFSQTSSEGIICKFETLEENEILGKEEEPYLFISDPEVISENIDSPFEWKKASGHIATFEKHHESGWPSNWKIVSADTTKSSYFIGVKFKSSNLTKIGWIEMEIDSESGAVNIIEKVIL